MTKAPPFGKVTTAAGDLYNLRFAFGGRSYSVWNDEGRLVFDSGGDFEAITEERLLADFNSTDNANKSGDTRSESSPPRSLTMSHRGRRSRMPSSAQG